MFFSNACGSGQVATSLQATDHALYLRDILLLHDAVSST